MKNILIGIIALAIIGLGAWGIVSLTDSTEENEVVAVVNEEEISRTQFEETQSQIALNQNIDIATLDAESKTALQNQTIEALISQTLLRQNAEHSDITINDARLEAELEIVRGQFENEELFTAALADADITEDDLRSNIEAELITQAYLEQELTLSTIGVTDEEVQTAYDETSAVQEVPPLEEVRDQVEAMVLQQKQQGLIAAHIQELHDEADIEILI